ncbi:MAG TPA: glycosyltransferase family 4 protein [Candidatus Binataceae bacterium]|nr:glycosyltransferase family 4 protein [Candidatus Binataceae bacterium]
MLKRPLKILYLAIGVFDKGGISRYCRYQIRALRELVGEGNVSVLSLMGPSTDDFEGGFDVERSFRGVGLRSEVDFFLTGIRKALAMRPDLIWSSHVRFLPNALLQRMATGAYFALNVYGEELWGGRLLPLYRRTLHRADLVVPDCHATADYIARKYGVQPSRSQVVWDCVDLQQFQPRPPRIDLLRKFGIPAGGRRYLLTLGRIERRSRYKGYDRLLDALGALRKRSNIVLLYAGTGDDLGRIKRRVLEEDLEDRVFFLGSVSEADLCDVYNLADVFALVTDRGPRRGEGIPLTPLEAAACGTPIIVGNEDGSREAVVDEVTGFCVSPRHPEALQRAIEKLMLNDRLREKMGRAARERIEAEFSYETFRNKTEMILARVAERPPLN